MSQTQNLSPLLSQVLFIIIQEKSHSVTVILYMGHSPPHFSYGYSCVYTLSSDRANSPLFVTVTLYPHTKTNLSPFLLQLLLRLLFILIQGKLSPVLLRLLFIPIQNHNLSPFLLRLLFIPIQKQSLPIIVTVTLHPHTEQIPPQFCYGCSLSPYRTDLSPFLTIQSTLWTTGEDLYAIRRQSHYLHD